jgi:hypothetical protein
MTTVDGFTGAIGNTPLIRLPNLSAATGREVFGKAEFLNPGGSVKDRAASRRRSTMPCASSRVATLPCDGVDRYRSRIYDADRLAENDLVPQAKDLSFL